MVVLNKHACRQVTSGHQPQTCMCTSQKHTVNKAKQLVPGTYGAENPHTVQNFLAAHVTEGPAAAVR